MLTTNSPWDSFVTIGYLNKAVSVLCSVVCGAYVLRFARRYLYSPLAWRLGHHKDLMTLPEPFADYCRKECVRQMLERIYAPNELVRLLG